MRLQDTDKAFVEHVWNKSVTPTLGGDPEFFVVNKDKKVLASDKFFPSKEKPLIFDGMASQVAGGQKLRLFFDGIQAEMNIGANYCREYMAFNIHQCLKKAFIEINKKCKTHHIVLSPSVKVTKQEILKADPEARRFGCMPDFNAYTLTTNTAEIDATEHPYRYAGGHIHLGVSSSYIKKSSAEGKIAKTEDGHIRVIKLLDLIVGIPCILLDSSPEAIIRRSHYGKAGCFRPTPYGIEYRTPSCWWIKSPLTTSLILGLARLAWSIASFDKDEELFKLIKCDPEDIRGISDENDREKALEVWKRLRPYVALASSSSKNPLHIKSVVTFLFPDNYSARSGKSLLSVNTMGKARGPSQEPIFSLATFEYLIQNGLEALVSGDIRKEWQIGVGKRFQDNYGFLYEGHRRLQKCKDFFKFQASFLKEIV